MKSLCGYNKKTASDRRLNWFVVQLKPNSVAIAERNLKRQGFSTFFPVEDVTETRGGRFTERLRPLFPGYLFVAFDRADGAWRAIRSTAGVSRLVTFGEQPAEVPGEIVDQILERCDARGTLLPQGGFAPGDQVQLTKGPFSGFLAEIEKLAPEQRVWVLLDVLGQKTRVAIGTGQLRSA